PRAHLVLGESYLRLLRDTRERSWGQRLPELRQLRQAQASTALNQAITLKPDFAEAHLDLVRLYGSMGYLDLTLKHQQTYARLVGAAGLPAGFKQDMDRLTRLVKKREDEFLATASPRSGVQDRAALAVRKGLAGKALEMLLESHISAFGPGGAALE